MTWVNSDGLIVKFGSEEAGPGRGGSKATLDGRIVIEFLVDYTDVQSTSYTRLGSVSSSINSPTGNNGVEVSSGLRIEAVEVIAQTAFTSSGTIGTSVFSMGLVREDQSTELDNDGLLTTSFVGGVIDAAGERTYVTPGVTGAGALIGTTLSNNGFIVLANTQHGSHPFTAGKAKIRIYGYFPSTTN